MEWLSVQEVTVGRPLYYTNYLINFIQWLCVPFQLNTHNTSNDDVEKGKTKK